LVEIATRHRSHVTSYLPGRSSVVEQLSGRKLVEFSYACPYLQEFRA
jgi:hypothetical protein